MKDKICIECDNKAEYISTACNKDCPYGKAHPTWCNLHIPYCVECRGICVEVVRINDL